MSTFGERLRGLRREAGLSQQDLAGEALSASYVSLLESDKRQPSHEAMAHLAARLGCSPAALDAGDAAEGARSRAAMELSYARIATVNGESAHAAARLREVLGEDALEQSMRDDVTFALAGALELSDDVPGAVRLLLPLFERALERRSHLPVSTVGHALCARYLQSGDLNAAVSVGERALAAAEARGLTGSNDHLKLAATLIWAHYERGDLLHAAALATHYGELAEQHGNRGGQAMVHWNAALVAEAAGHLDQAVSLAQRAAAYLGESSTTRHLVRLRTQLAWLLVRADPARAAEAGRLLDGLTEDLADQCGPADRALWGCHRGYVHLLMGQAQDAERLARGALLELSGQQMGETAQALLILGDALLAQGRKAEAVDQWQAVVTVQGSRPGGRAKAAMLREVGERLLGADRTDQGMSTLRLALDAAGIQVPALPGVARVAEPALR